MIQFGFQDFLDIFLTALLLFYIYRLMKQTRSGRIFTGILIFIFMWLLVSRVFEMRMMSMIMNQVMSIGAIALIVIFQEEIRGILFRIGTSRRNDWFFRLLSRRKEEETGSKYIQPLVSACQHMSRDKVGALIVIERTMTLSEIARTGQRIDAEISARLLENLFFKNSPLHDGALLISNNRIDAAGCILPVSHNEDIPAYLGLRHRSGMGVCEMSDALVIIVSEETGYITVAMDGKFTRHMSSDALEKLLREHWK